MAASSIGGRSYTTAFQSTAPTVAEKSSETAEASLSVSAVEKAAIEGRRAKVGRNVGDPDYIGLALSGGGIRSASFCLGVLQALDSRKCIDRIDYLSTVSGGGYAGCSMTAGMTKTKGQVPFNAPGDYSDTPAVQHLRDFSNYLIPRGGRDIIIAIGLILRGLAANALLVSPFLLFSILLLFVSFPTRESLKDYGPSQRLVDFLKCHCVPFVPRFPATTILAAVGFLLLVAWAFAKSIQTSDLLLEKEKQRPETQSAELEGPWVTVWRAFVVVIAAIFWLELQPVLFNAYLNGSGVSVGCFGHADAANCLTSTVQTWFTKITPLLAPAAAVVTFLSRQLGRLSRPTRNDSRSSIFRRLGAKLLLWLAAIVVPSFLGLLYFAGTDAAQQIQGRPWHDTAAWIALAAITTLGLACLINPNATSLHRLYRDRLSKAFLFDPENREGEDLAPFVPKLHEIDPKFCPFPIVNAAINLEGSAFANRRGRNADFFEFTPEFSGSEATGWVGSALLGNAEPKLDLGTAMAISGAAVSPNMGSATIKPLTPTLALLNVRLGFWLTNPRYAEIKPSTKGRIVDIRSFLLLKELLSRVDETSRTVYVTDGGNIENLGIHALLRRRCSFIVAVDAEADPDLAFPSLLKLSRYARIDFGALIDVPWQGITDRSLIVNEALAKGERIPAGSACHIAVGDIRYGPDARGTLIYIKASVTGDEPDYILDYKRRNPEFPHETTGDQFFGEEQLEAYRALGFHIARRFLDEKATFEVTPQEGGETVEQARQRSLKKIREILLGLHPPVPPQA